MGERIWWCEAHSSRFLEREPDDLAMCLWMLHENNWDTLPEPESCRAAERLLADPGALLIERDADYRDHPIFREGYDTGYADGLLAGHYEGYGDALAAATGEEPG